MSATPKEDIQLELYRRELARRRLGDFTRYTMPTYLDARHQDLLNEKLEQLEAYYRTGGKQGISRLIVTMPPRHGKSEKVSVRFPGWFIGRNPDASVIITSYAASLAENFSRQVRNLVQTNDYQNIFGKTSCSDITVELDPEGKSVQSWGIKGRRGGLVAAGVGGGITGRGADLLIIDDPVKDREEADSEIIRQKVWDWWTSTAYTRLSPCGVVIVMMTRWHEDDLVGKILKEMPEGWEVLNLPALAEEDDQMKRPMNAPLWPDRFPPERLTEIRRVLPARDWNALYQQRPSAKSGNVFKRDWFKYGQLPHPDEIIRGIQVWDTALTEKEENDYSACCTLFVTREGAFVADIYRGHLGFPELQRAVSEKYELWSRHFPISRVFIESKAAGESLEQTLRKLTTVPVMLRQPDSERGRSKLQRAEVAAGWVQMGNVTFKQGANWQYDFEEELVGFPYVGHDDMVDAFVYAVLEVKGGGQKAKSNFKRYKSEMYEKMGRVDRHDAIMGGWGG